jgi:hypothetical protein
MSEDKIRNQYILSRIEEKLEEVGPVRYGVFEIQLTKVDGKYTMINFVISNKEKVEEEKLLKKNEGAALNR